MTTVHLPPSFEAIRNIANNKADESGDNFFLARGTGQSYASILPDGKNVCVGLVLPSIGFIGDFSTHGPQ